MYGLSWPYSALCITNLSVSNAFEKRPFLVLPVCEFFSIMLVLDFPVCTEPLKV